MKIKHFYTATGTPVPNQFKINFTKGIVFQSYDSLIAFKGQGMIVLGSNWNYSSTTGKYRNEFLGETKKETQKKIDSGEYVIDDVYLENL